MSDNLDFSIVDTTESSNSGNKYLTPGVHTLKVSKVEAGKSFAKQSPYVAITVTNDNEEICTEEFYLNGGAFPISADRIAGLVASINNISKEEAKAKLVNAAINTDNIADKLAPMMVGKKFGFIINGKHTTYTNAENNTVSFVKSVFSNVSRPLARIGELKFNPDKNITGTPVVTTAEVKTEKSVTNW